jgi:hypothetical protein
MTAITFWLADWEHECCGDRRMVGETIAVSLSFDGSIEATDEPDSVEPIGDGQMLMVGSTRISEKTEPGWIVETRGVEFGYAGERVGPRVRCNGELWEQRHGSPEGGTAVGHTTGRISMIRLHEVNYELISGRSYARVGRGVSKEMMDTGEKADNDDGDASEVDISRDAPRGRWLFMPRPTVASPSTTGWEFEFGLEITD